MKNQDKLKIPMEWVKPEDELPEEGVKVIVLTDHYTKYPDNCYTGLKWGSIFHFSDTPKRDRIDFSSVTHWMPLPSPPKE